MMLAATMQVVSLAACAVILSRSEPAVARMDKATNMPVRIAMHFLTMGAVGQIGAILIYGDIPTLQASIALVGIAALLLCERRVRALTGPLGRASDRSVTRAAK